MKRMVRLLAVFGLLMGTLATAMPVGAAYHSEWLQYARPKYSQTQVAWVALCDDQNCSSPRVGVPVHATWNFAAGAVDQDWQTGNDGKAALVHGGGSVGETVRIDISFVNSHGVWQNADSLSFTIDPDNEFTAPVDSSYVPSYQPSYSAPAYTPPQSSDGPVAGSNFVCPAGYPIKANDNSGIYHVPGGQYYDATNAYNCFATEAAAQAAGYRKSLR